MNEDRRPNVAGVPLHDEETPAPDAGSEELHREARLLRDRGAADGHEPPAGPPGEEDEGS